MVKTNLKTLKVCKLCGQDKALEMPLTKTTGIVNKKTIAGLVCIGYVGKMVCGWQEIAKA